jgi:ornithine cyclodeaminase
VITDKEPGRERDDQVTIFDSVGFAIEDFSALCYVHERASISGHFTDIDLVAEPEDPKDLFGMIGAPVPVG